MYDTADRLQKHWVKWDATAADPALVACREKGAEGRKVRFNTAPKPAEWEPKCLSSWPLGRCLLRPIG